MYRQSGKFIAYRQDGMLHEFLAAETAKAQAEVDQRSEDELFSTGESALIEQIAARHRLETPRLDFDAMGKPTSAEIEVPFEDPFFGGARRSMVKRPMFTYHIPFTGDARLFRYSPNTFSLSNPEVYVDGNNLCFDVIAMHEDPSFIRGERDRIVSTLKQYDKSVADQVSAYNDGLSRAVEGHLIARKQRVQKRRDLEDQL